MREQYKVEVNVSQDELKIIQCFRASTAMYQQILLSTAIAGAAACQYTDNVVNLFMTAS